MLKCSVKRVRLGLRSSFCSWAQIRTSGISIFRKSSASSSVICSAICSDLKSSSMACLQTNICCQSVADNLIQCRPGRQNLLPCINIQRGQQHAGSAVQLLCVALLYYLHSQSLGHCKVSTAQKLVHKVHQ